jgi:hypothetical protein
MIGQVYSMAFRAADMPEEAFFSKSTCHYYAFRCGVKGLGIRKEPAISMERTGPEDFSKVIKVMEDNRKDQALQAAARHFLLDVGTRMWEENFGKHWDAAWNKKEKGERNEKAS